MDLLICSTPFQIFTALNLRLSKVLTKECDVLLFDYFDGVKEYKDKLEKLDFFNRIKIVNAKKILKACRDGRRLQKNLAYLKNFIFSKSFVQRNSFLCTYSRVFYSYPDPNVIILLHYYKKLNSEIKLFGYDDGATDYLYAQNEVYHQPLITKFFSIPYNAYVRDVILLYSISLSPDPSSPVYLKREISKEHLKKENKELFNFVFGYSPEKAIGEHCVFFDQMSFGDTGVSDNHNAMAVKELKRKYGDSLIVKKHPRRSEDIYACMDVKCYGHQSIPFEVLTMNIDCEDKLFVSIFSSASFMPKVLYDYEPSVIFLVNVWGKSSQEVARFIERLSSVYGQKERIMCPDSFQEYRELVTSFEL